MGAPSVSPPPGAKGKGGFLGTGATAQAPAPAPAASKKGAQQGVPPNPGALLSGTPYEAALGGMSGNITNAIATNTMGMMDQRLADGSSINYRQTGTKSVYDPATGQTFKVPEYAMEQSLSPAMQKAGEFSRGATREVARAGRLASGNLSDIYDRPMTADGLPDRGFVPGMRTLQDGIASGGDITRSYGTDFSDDRGRVEAALMERMQPYLDRDREQMQTRLANQGIGLGSEAFGRAQDDFGRSVNDARLGAILSAGQEQSRMVGMERDRAGFENAAQAQAFGQNTAQAGQFNQARLGEFGQQMERAGLRDSQRGDAMAEQFAYRQAPMQEIAALLSMGNPQAQPAQIYSPSPMANTDIAGLINSEAQREAAEKAQRRSSKSSMTGNLIGAAGTIGAAFMSDRRLKRDVVRIGTRGGFPLYEFSYVWGGPRRRGYMAQEVAEVMPEAVRRVGEWLALDYSMLPEVN